MIKADFVITAGGRSAFVFADLIDTGLRFCAERAWIRRRNAFTGIGTDHAFAA